MASGDPIRVFVTHAWQEHDDYLRVFEYLESARNFRYQNVSILKHPAGAGVEAEREELRRQIGRCEAVIALASLIKPQHELLYFEINCARGTDKPVLLLPPFGHELQLPLAYKGLADEEIRWDERAIVDALLRQARHHESTRWDTIEFKLEDFKPD
jgi:hypothetical protein